jgi:DNA-binding NtrC family response regulator
MRALVLDDDSQFRRSMSKRLRCLGVESSEADSARRACERIAACPHDLLLVDLCLVPGADDRSGLEFVRTVRERGCETPIVLVSALRDFDAARSAFGFRVKDYVLKQELSDVRLRSLLVATIPAFQSPMRSRGVDRLVGTSVAMASARRIIARVGQSDVPVLILGESGTGKEVAAQAIHEQSPRWRGPFLAVNCASVPDALFESEVFGHDRGAFTGATTAFAGCIEEAGSGTLFLDEIGELPPASQGKLLRVLENGTYRGLGSSRQKSLGCRVLCATNADLALRVETGDFRTDLFHRLNIVTIQLPTLPERAEDIPDLVNHFSNSLGRPLTFTSAALASLARRPWRGNVRELRNLVRRIDILTTTRLIDEPDLQEFDEGKSRAPSEPRLAHAARSMAALPGTLREKVEAVETEAISRALRASAGSVTAAAGELGLDRKALERRLVRRRFAGDEATPLR